MNLHDRRFTVLRRLALCCAVMVLAVTGLSAYLRLAKGGLGCADVPACYGQDLRSLQQGKPALADQPAATTAARLGHRIVAVIALLLAIAMVAECLGQRPALRVEAAMALAVLGLALFLAVLGRWSSGARIPAIAIGNLLGGFAMLALCARLAVAGRPARGPGWTLGGLLALWLVVLLVVLQTALGGLVSASFAGLSCVGWAECVDAARGLDLAALNPWREPQLLAQPPFNPSGALAQLLHRGLALALCTVLVPVAMAAWRRGRGRVAAALLLLLAAQLAIGFSMMQGSLGLGSTWVHNQLAALMLAALVLLL